MSVNQVDFTRILGLLGLLGGSILAWAASQFATLPNRVTAIEAKAVMGEARLDRIENKLDKIFEAVKK
jgi:hypothetical protein